MDLVIDEDDFEKFAHQMIVAFPFMPEIVRKEWADRINKVRSSLLVKRNTCGCLCDCCMATECVRNSGRGYPAVNKKQTRKDCYNCGTLSCDCAMIDGTGVTTKECVEHRKKIHNGTKCVGWSEL